MFKGARPTLTSAPATTDYAASFSVQTPDAASISSVVLVGMGRCQPHLQHERAACAADLQRERQQLDGAGAGEHQLAAPPGYYMLFLINAQGIPSLREHPSLV